ncbi:hypothetical protein, partial [Mesorhizobium sp.]|uniref:hypothetical protein n=1 Tax=Mesorhizobium sp. TaxID=1871066 RepID=UPI0025BE377E
MTAVGFQPAATVMPSGPRIAPAWSRPFRCGVLAQSSTFAIVPQMDFARWAGPAAWDRRSCAHAICSFSRLRREGDRDARGAEPEQS